MSSIRKSLAFASLTLLAFSATAQVTYYSNWLPPVQTQRPVAYGQYLPMYVNVVQPTVNAYHSAQNWVVHQAPTVVYNNAVRYGTQYIAGAPGVAARFVPYLIPVQTAYAPSCGNWRC